MMKTAPPIHLADDERTALLRWAKGRRTPYRLVLRAKIVLRAAEGMLNKDIAQALHTTPTTVGRWRRRFFRGRLAGIEKDNPRGRRRPAIGQRVQAEIIHKTTHERPPNGIRWTTRSMAAAVGVSHSTVQRIWRAVGLRPSRGGA